MNDQPLDAATAWGEPARANLPEYTVSELSQALKRSVEENFSHVRVRGEISGYKRHSSGHCYFALKDAEAVLDAVCWRQTAIRLPIRPEDGMEVVCTGRLTTYPGRSKYQLVVDSIALAGIGALLRILEERRQRLAAEGLFAAERKKKLPFLPEVIGIVTSPTGAVIRDILHRLADRFPRRVLLWPVAGQGEGAAAQIAAAIQGFRRLTGGLSRLFTSHRQNLAGLARGLPDPQDLLGAAAQRLDDRTERLRLSIAARFAGTRQRLELAAARLRPAALAADIRRARDRLHDVEPRLAAAVTRAFAAKHDAVDNFAGRLTTHSERHESLLARGYVVVRDAAEKVVTEAVKVRPNTALELEFYDGKVGSIAGGSRRPVKRTVPPIGHGDLFQDP